MTQKLNNLLLKEMVNGMELAHRSGGKVDIVFNNPFGTKMKASTVVPEGFVKTVSHSYRDPKSGLTWDVKVNNRPVKFSAQSGL